MANVFNSVKGLHPRRNVFSAHTYRNDFTGSLGLNIPVYQQHVPPASRVRVGTSALVRLQALIAPVMDNIDFYVHFWQLPYRLIENDQFTKFISGEIEPEEYVAIFATPVSFAKKCILGIEQIFPTSVVDYQVKRVAYYKKIFGNGSLMDYLGYDINLFPVYTGDAYSFGNNETKFNFRPLIAYYMLHLNWYMNENVPYWANFVTQVDSVVKNASLENLCALLVYAVHTFGHSCLPHGWEKDYFTSALPNVQAGEPVSLPIAGQAPVTVANVNEIALYNQSGLAFHLDDPLLVGFDGAAEGDSIYCGEDAQQGQPFYLATGLDSVITQIRGGVGSEVSGVPTFKQGGITRNNLLGTADLSEATAITVNEFRFANALQVFKERQLRFGHRRLEHYKGFFDVTPEDLRLQIPKYLGGGRIPINISDIEQTSQSTDTSKQGNLAGKGTAVAGGFAGFTTFCSEESVIIGIAFAMPHITYSQATSKFLLKTDDIYEYFNPSFEHLGEQVIENIELYAGADDPDGEFGYTPRYNEYRFHLNEMHGDFKSSLAFWTLGRIFDGSPALNAEFIYMQPAVFDRIFAVSGSSPMLVSMLFRTRIIQPVSKYGTPMLLC